MPDATRKEFNLDVDSPDKVLPVLRKSADEFYESASELTSEWQDKGAGRPWEIIARELEICANKIEKKLIKAGVLI